MPLVLRPPGDALALADRLADLGRDRRRALVLAGLFRVLAVGTAAVLAATLLDAVVHLPAVARALVLAVALTSVVVLYRLGVRGPSRESADPLATAHRLEARFPRFNDALASAVAFGQPDADTRPGSARLRGVAVVRATNLATRYALDEIVPAGRAWRWFWLLAGAGALAVGFAGAAPSRARVAVLRLADPYGGHQWPTRTTLEVLQPAGFPVRMARGEGFDLRFAVRGVVPESAAVFVRLDGAAPAEELVPLSPAEDGADTTAGVHLDAGRIPKDFAVRVTANDADTGWLPVTVAPPPALVPLGDRPSPLIRLVYPGYTDLPPADLPDGTGVAEAVSGTRVHLRAAADRRLASAVIRPQFDTGPARLAAAVALLNGTDPFAAVGSHLLAAEASADIPVAISGPAGTHLEADFVPRLPGLYALRFTDETGLTGSRLLDLRILPDPAPLVALGRPDPARDPLTLLPTASVPLQARAEDRVFALRDVTLEYRVGGPEVPFRSVPLADADAAGKLIPAVAGPVGPIRVRPVGLDVIRSIPLASLVKADGTAPGDGDLVTLRVAATDWDDVSRLKPPGRSREVTIRVASRASLEAIAQKELAQLRPELVRLREEQRKARETVDEVRAKAAAGTAGPDEAGALARAEAAQRQVLNQVADPADGLRAKSERLRQTLRANGPTPGPTAARAEAVADDLARLADGTLEAADPAVGAAKEAADKSDAPKLAAAAGRAAAAQRLAEAGFDKLLERLDQWGGAGEVRGHARALADDLKAAGADAAAAAARAPGADPAQMAAADRAALGRAADKLDRLAEQAAGVVGKAGRLAAEKAKQADALDAAGGDKAAAERARAEADALRAAVAGAGGDALPADLKGAADAVRRNQPGRAETDRRAAADKLAKLADALSEKPAAGASEPAADPKAAADLEKLADDQDELRKKVKAAAEQPDPAQRADALRQLAPQEAALKQRSEELSRRLTKDQPAAAETLRRAAAKMDADRAALDRGEPPAGDPADALGQLDDARDQLPSDPPKPPTDALARERREELAEPLKALRDRQAAILAEAGRLQAGVLEAKDWNQGPLRSYRDLDDTEKALAGEVRTLADKFLKDTPVFGRLAAQAAAALDRAADRVAERVRDVAAPGYLFDPVAEATADARVRRPMRDALRRLDQVLAAVKEEPKPAAPPKPGDEKPPEEKPAEEKAREGGPGMPPLAQLKALRQLQAEVNERTAALGKAHPDPATLSDDEKDELKELEQLQREVAELFDKLVPALGP